MPLLGDDGTKTSPGFDTFDPSAITGDELIFNDIGIPVIRTILAPAVALPGDAFYQLKFMVATPLPVALPGSSGAVDLQGRIWLTMSFAPGTGPTDVQITAVDKSESTAGAWLVFL